MRFFSRAGVVGVLAIACALFAYTPAQALTVSPVLYDFEGMPGESVQGVIKLTNDSGRADTFALEARNFLPYGEDGAQTYVEDDVSGLASWVQFDRPSVFLQEGETASFPFAVAVPQGAEPGGHYAAIFFSRVPDQTAGSGVGIGGAIGVLLLVNVTGEVHEEARIESFTVRGSTVRSHLPVFFDVRIRNLGSVHFRPRGDLEIRNLFGQVVHRADMNMRNAAVLPNSVRRVESAWARTFDEAGDGWIAGIQNEWRNFAIGPYTASVRMTYGSQAWQLATSEVSFWVVPWRLLLIAFVALLAFIGLMMLYHRMVVASVLAKEQKRQTRGKK